VLGRFGFSYAWLVRPRPRAALHAADCPPQLRCACVLLALLGTCVATTTLTKLSLEPPCAPHPTARHLCIRWPQLMMMQFTLSLYALFRTRRAELRSHIDSKNIEQLKAQIAEEKARAKLERLSSSARCKGPDATAVLGTKWEEIGTERPKTGTEISNEGLAAALETKLEFEKTEWEAFQVSNLTVDSFIEVQKKYLRPAPVPVEGEAKYLPMLSLAGELYLHVIAGQILAYQIGYYRMDTVLMLPLVEMVIGLERFFPTFQRRCEVPFQRFHARKFFRSPATPDNPCTMSSCEATRKK